MRPQYLANMFTFLLVSTLFLSIIRNSLVTISSITLYQNYNPYIQPKLNYSNNFSIKSIDTQVVTKNWKNVQKAQIEEQVNMLKGLNVKYVAIAVPYDDPTTFKLWADTIHNAGLKVWYRSHWNSWEGDNNVAKGLSPSDYLRKTQNFIRDNRTIFKEGDSFTTCVEAENVGVGKGKVFSNWDEYRSFTKNQIDMANITFTQIGLQNKVHTTWISVNGWVALNQFDKATVDYIGLITVDEHSTSTASSTDYANNLLKELDAIHNKWKKPIFVGEWGYAINKDMSEERQAEFVKTVLTAFDNRDYIVGVNYWVHMGHYSKLLNDEYGKNLTYRKSAIEVKNIFSMN